VPVQVDVRVVTATNKNLRAAVAARRFREDLYFRLSVFPITVPPLRERASDIPALARHFVERFCREQGKTVTLSPAALDALSGHDWPGNVRELQNCVERAVVLAEDTIQAGHLQLLANAVPEPAPSHRDATLDPWALINLSGSLPDVSRRVLAESNGGRSGSHGRGRRGSRPGRGAPADPAPLPQRQDPRIPHRVTGLRRRQPRKPVATIAACSSPSVTSSTTSTAPIRRGSTKWRRPARIFLSSRIASRTWSAARSATGGSGPCA